MHTHDLSPWQHSHSFNTGHTAAELRTRWVLGITLSMMVAEIAAGWQFHSMALLADGWHMSSHALAIGLSTFAYAAARRHANDHRFAFGTWKIEILAGFASAILLLGVAIVMVGSSIERLLAPEPIQYLQATIVAGIGLVVNVVCALILGQTDHEHEHGHRHPPVHKHIHHEHDHADHGHHDHDHGHPHDNAEARQVDLNLKSAYLHVVADAATSFLAIIALLGGWRYGWAWLDPAMGLVGAILVAGWARNLITETSKILLDREMDHPVVELIKKLVEAGSEDGDRLADLHIWRVGRNAYACAMSVVTHDQDLTANQVRERISQCPEIAHSTVEIHWCSDGFVPAE